MALNLSEIAGREAAGGPSGGRRSRSTSSHSFGAHFVEVTWQPELARLRVSRIVSVIDAGRIIDPLLARNQIEGSLVMGIGMALLEGTEYDLADRRADEREAWPTTSSPRTRTCRHSRSISLNTPIRTSTPSASEAWARSASPARPRRSRMRFITQPACECVNFH